LASVHMNDPKNAPGLANPNTQKRTLVEEGTKFKGSLTSTCPVLVQGTVEGNVESPAVTVSATGTLSGKIVASTFKSEGKVAGELDVDTAQLAGQVDKNTIVRASSLDLKLTQAPGAGKVQLTFGAIGKKPS
jgi:cytoskeletal protein CcmA (bactofilin family)